MPGNRRYPTFQVILLFFLVVLGITSQAQKTYQYSDKRFIYKLLIDSALSSDSVNYECCVKSIAIMRKADKKVIQQIFPPENTACLPQDQQFIIEDINFDGLNDIRLVRFIPAAPNIPYYFWVFDNATGRFKRTKLFEDITTPEFDHRKKLIFSSWRAGWDDRGASTYKIIAGKPVLIEEYEIKDMEGDTTKRIATQKKRINGKLRLVKRTIENIDEDK